MLYKRLKIYRRLELKYFSDNWASYTIKFHRFRYPDSTKTACYYCKWLNYCKVSYIKGYPGINVLAQFCGFIVNPILDSEFDYISPDITKEI